ncbi:hypothetical protein [Streptomyces sp. DH12]|uniref:hypothetical protein n=1 Tax=Streptomyces sp. DH12 TaxID=2857010 RepID=UPI001E3E169B|nr:hypothetical protein [Streptomyces sp. DH12]
MNHDHDQPPTIVDLHMTTPRLGQWCPTCKAATGYTADAITLTPSGVTVVGHLTGCEVCDVPDTPETRRAQESRDG